MANKFVNVHKTRKIIAIIDKQIILRTEQLSTFVLLKKSLERRMIRGELLESDLDMVRSAMRNLNKR
jgi:hypothetical protein